MVISEQLTEAFSTEGSLLIRRALNEGLPLVAILGQLSGWSLNHPDPALGLALSKAQRPGNDWKSLISRQALPDGFFEWLGERFFHRAPTDESIVIADAAFSAIYTSSIDPGLVNLFTTGGRQPEPILIGDPPPPVTRSRRRPPFYYLFGRAGAGLSDFRPPGTLQALSQRRLRHVSAMLRTLNETATSLGVVVIDG